MGSNCVDDELRFSLIQLHALVHAAGDRAEAIEPAPGVEQVQALIGMAEDLADSVLASLSDELSEMKPNRLGVSPPDGDC